LSNVVLKKDKNEMPKTLNNLVDLDKHPNKIENNKLNN
jgi:hypothetical protein